MFFRAKNKVLLIVNFILGLAISQSVAFAWGVDIASKFVDTLLGIYILCYGFGVLPFVIFFVEGLFGAETRWYCGLALTIPMYWLRAIMFGEPSERVGLALHLVMGLSGLVLPSIANWLGKTILNTFSCYKKSKLL